jgi:hypothetical protein
MVRCVCGVTLTRAKSHFFAILYEGNTMTLSHEILGEEEKCLYEVMFLKNDRHQDVYIELIEKINSEELGKRLQLRE